MYSLWRHEKETLFLLPTLCENIPRWPLDTPHKEPVLRTMISLMLALINSWIIHGVAGGLRCHWCSLWRHCNVLRLALIIVIYIYHIYISNKIYNEKISNRHNWIFTSKNIYIYIYNSVINTWNLLFIGNTVFIKHLYICVSIRCIVCQLKAEVEIGNVFVLIPAAVFY